MALLPVRGGLASSYYCLLAGGMGDRARGTHDPGAACTLLTTTLVLCSPGQNRETLIKVERNVPFVYWFNQGFFGVLG